MKRKTVKIMALMLAATMVFGTVTVGAEELEIADNENISADEDSVAPELSLDEDVSVGDSSFADDMNNEAIVCEGPDTFSDEAADESVVESNGANKNNKIKKSSAKVFKKIRGGKNGKNKFMYNKLTKAEKKIYDKIDKEVTRLLYNGGQTVKHKGYDSYRYTKEFYTEKFKNQNDKFRHVYEIYMVDNPQAFFLSQENIASTKKNGKTFYCEARINNDTKTAKTIKDRGDEIAKNLEADAKIVGKEKSAYKKLYKIHEIICTRLENGSDFINGDFGGLHTSYYKNRKGGDDYVYSTAFVALARLCGFEAYHVYGDSYGHVSDWVKIKLGKNWYNVDPDKCDVPLEEGDYERGFSLKYFLKNDTDIDKDAVEKHVIVPEFKKYYPKTCKTSYVLPVQ